MAAFNKGLNKQQFSSIDEYLRAKWKHEKDCGYFDIEPYLRDFPELPAFADFFTTNLKLDPDKHIPALPMRYAADYNAERVMYLYGVPRAMTRERLHEILNDLGTVKKLPTLTDLSSKETFRWVIMSTKEEATRLHKILHLMNVPECGKGYIMAISPCVPSRGLILDFHTEYKTYGPRPKDDFVPIYGEKVDISDALTLPIEVKDDVSFSVTKQPKPLSLNALAASFSTPHVSSTSKVRPNPLNQENVDPLGRYSAVELALPMQLQTNTKQKLAQFARNGNQCVAYLHSGYGYTPHTVVKSPTRPMPVDPLVALMRRAPASKPIKVDISQIDSTHTPAIADLSYESTITEIVAKPAIESSLERVGTPLTPRRSTSATIPSHHETLSIPASESLQSGVEYKNKGSSFITRKVGVISPPVASSWASVAIAGAAAKVIDITPMTNNNPTNRLRSFGRVPYGANPSKTEPLADQMRVVFILDVPSNLTYDDVSHAVREGPLRSIHFGVDEDKNNRFVAIVFQYAKDALTFVRVLQKERVDSRPDRFRWVVDVVRGEEPFPTDDILRAMQAPTFATRRLTLVKASLFFMVGDRQLRARIERIVGEGTIQLIWLYNGGNATIVFSDVSSAIAVKENLDKYSSTTGQKDGAPQAWAGLQVTFSKDPCVQPLELKTALQ